jgi:Fe2+ or Zn2+ uptake regulation protein
MHLICEVCGTVEDKEVDEVLIPLEKKSDFLLSHSQINLYGTCHTCQNVS